MEPKRRRIFIPMLLLLAIGNFIRMKGSEDMRPVLFLSVLAIGIFSGLLIREIVDAYKNKQQK